MRAISPSHHRRTQARIWTASTLCPKNKFTLDPEDPGELPFGHRRLGPKLDWLLPFGSSPPPPWPLQRRQYTLL